MPPLRLCCNPVLYPMTADKVTDLRDKFRDAFTGWLEIEKAA
jgi:hypothetical protein